MNVAVYNRGDLSKKVIERLSAFKHGVKTVAIFGLSQEPCDATWCNGMRVLGLEDVARHVRQGDINALVVPDMSKRVNEVLPYLCELDSVPIYYASMKSIRSDGGFDLKLIDCKKPWLSVVEYHVCDICNMNCKGCGHCANIIEEPGFPDCDEYARSLARLSELFDGIGLIRLLGGEPLLNPELIQFLMLSRQHFPYTDLRIVTNGILLHEMSDELKNYIRQECITIDVSLYPPMHHLEGRIHQELLNQNLMHSICQVDKFYRRFVPEGGNNRGVSFANCRSSDNHLLYKGRIASCAMPFSIKVLNERFGYGIEHNSWINLFDTDLDGFEVNRMLNMPSSLCSYCNSRLETFDWERRTMRDAVASDWIFHE